MLHSQCMYGLAEKVAYLHSLGTFDHVESLIETHMSFVFLTEHRAFKLKKPVQLPYLDHSTLANRKRSCENELRLGRRLAASVYEQIAPLVATPSGLQIGGDGEVVDWLVVMRRLDTERMLPAMLARGEATLAHADAVGDLLVRFYRGAQRAEWTAAEYLGRMRRSVFEVAGELIARGAGEALVEDIVHRQLVGLVRERGTLEDRVRAGRVLEAHGDLRPEHVCLEQPPVIIDPLEFNEDLRTLDTASELAFFALECERLGAAWFGERVFAGYSARTGDRIPSDVIVLYRARHALTRALLALRHLDDTVPADHERWRRRAAYYLSATELPTARPSSARGAAY